MGQKREAESISVRKRRKKARNMVRKKQTKVIIYAPVQTAPWDPSGNGIK